VLDCGGSQRMARTRALVAIVAGLVLTLGCGSSSSPIAPTPAPSTTISALASNYLEQVIGIMQANSIKRLTIDWTSFRNTVVSEAGAAQTVLDLYPAIRTALRLLGDGHSSYTSANGQVLFVAVRSCSGSGAGAPTLPATIGYVKVTSFSGSGAASTTFADGVQNAIMAADRDDLIGWIVDLRGNGGGNMWPMVAGVGPVLGEGTIGYFIDPAGAESAWEYRNGASLSGGVTAATVTTPYRLRRPQPKVAVLTDNGIASSGEATLIAFIKRANTRSFGVATCGLSTSNRGFPLSDGANLNLTTSVMADRAKTRYGDQVVPDEVIADQTQVVARAMAWLQAP
jgi:carboxyl-terminal processing protease